MEKESEKDRIYVYVYLNHFAVYLKLTQHCKSTMIQYKIKTEFKILKIKCKKKKKKRITKQP